MDIKHKLWILDHVDPKPKGQAAWKERKTVKNDRARAVALPVFCKMVGTHGACGWSVLGPIDPPRKLQLSKVESFISSLTGRPWRDLGPSWKQGLGTLPFGMRSSHDVCYVVDLHISSSSVTSTLTTVLGM